MLRAATGLALVLLGIACGRRAAEEAPPIDESKLNARHGTGTGDGPVVPARAAAVAPSPTTPVPLGDLGDEGSCTLTVAGPAALEDRGPGGRLAASSDYWIADAELDALAARRAAARGVEPRSLDPKGLTLRLSCVGGRARVDLAPTPRSRYADVPFVAQRYDVGSTGEAGTWLAQATVDGVAYPNGAGDLRLARFDGTGVAGRFDLTFRPAAGGEPLVIAGSFDFRCPREATKCTR
jgi:hypothetical protein